MTARRFVSANLICSLAPEAIRIAIAAIAVVIGSHSALAQPPLQLHEWKSTAGSSTQAAFRSLDSRSGTVTLLVQKQVRIDQLDEQSRAMAQRLAEAQSSPRKQDSEPDAEKEQLRKELESANATLAEWTRLLSLGFDKRLDMMTAPDKQDALIAATSVGPESLTVRQVMLLYRMGLPGHVRMAEAATKAQREIQQGAAIPELVDYRELEAIAAEQRSGR